MPTFPPSCGRFLTTAIRSLTRECVLHAIRALVTMRHTHTPEERHDRDTTAQQNKALVLKAFDTLFNKRDYATAETYWSQTTSA